MTIVEITSTGPLQKSMNHSLMVRWINEGLIERGHHDVRKSIVYYDEHKDFVLALANEPKSLSEKTLHDLKEIGVKYWSKGIV